MTSGPQLSWMLAKKRKTEWQFGTAGEWNKNIFTGKCLILSWTTICYLLVKLSMVNSLIYSQLLSPHRLISENILEHQLLLQYYY